MKIVSDVGALEYCGKVREAGATLFYIPLCRR